MQSRKFNPKWTPRHRCGAVTVEFAICASLFFTMTFATLEFGRYFYVRHAVQMAAYEGARAGIVPGASRSHVETRTNNLLEAAGVPAATVAVTPLTITPTTREVSVQVTCNFSENSWLPPTFLTDKVIEAVIELQHENNAYLDPEDEDLTSIIGDNEDEPIDL